MKAPKHLYCICHFCGGRAYPIGRGLDVYAKEFKLRDAKPVVKYGCGTCHAVIEKTVEY